MHQPPPRLLLFLLLALVVWLGGKSLPVSAATPEQVQEIVSYINQARADAGAPPVSLEPRLSAAAQRHSNDMAAHDFVSHTGSDGSNYWQRIEEAGYTPIVMAGEVIAAGQTDAFHVVEGWMNSPRHKEVLLQTDFVHLGVGHAQRDGTQYGNYWTVSIAQPGAGFATVTPLPSITVQPTRPLPTPSRTPAPTAYPPPRPTATPHPFPSYITSRMTPQQFLPYIIKSR